MEAQKKGNMDMDTNLDPVVQAVIHYRAVDQEHTVVLSCMDTHLEAVDIHKAEEGEEGKGDKENSQALLMEVLESSMKMKPPSLSMIWKMTFALCLIVQVVGRENRDKVACRKERAYNKDKDKDTEDIHRIRKDLGEQELNL
jgi:hypothetical protein